MILSFPPIGADRLLSCGETVGRSSTAIAHLSNVDPCTLAPRVGCSPFESLVRAIAYQQLHDKAAASILKRLIALFPDRRFLPTPKAMLRYGERWKSYRTVASWYLWRAAEGARRKAAASELNG